MLKKKIQWPAWITEHLNTKFFWDVTKTFIGVFLAFSLNAWAENLRLRKGEHTILTEIKNDLAYDIKDLNENIEGHNMGITACRYYRKMLKDPAAPSDSLVLYFNLLLRDFISLQHTAAYESLQSRGLELISDDSIRHKIVNVYDFQYEIIYKLEEKYEPHEFFKLYYKDMTELMAPHLEVLPQGGFKVVSPLYNMPAKDKTMLLLWLSRLQVDRMFLVEEYSNCRNVLMELKSMIEQKTNRH